MIHLVCFDNMLAGLIDQALKTIFVSRMDTTSRQECYNEIIRRVESEEEWPPVLIFPEGIARICLANNYMLHYQALLLMHRLL